MQNENLMEAAAFDETSISGEQAGSASSVETPTSGKRTRTAVPVVPVETPATVGVKIATRLDALRQRMLDGMGAAQAGPILGDLRRLAEYTGLEDEIAMREDAAELAS